MIISDTMSPLLKGIGHIMRMTLLAPKFADLDLTRESILLLLPPSGGESLIGVTTTAKGLNSFIQQLCKRLESLFCRVAELGPLLGSYVHQESV